jgi:hypothetical protein
MIGREVSLPIITNTLKEKGSFDYRDLLIKPTLVIVIFLKEGLGSNTSSIGAR